MQQLANAYIDRITRQQITPLILSNIDDADPPSQLDESDPGQRLRQNISQLMFSAHMFNIHLSIADTFTNKMIASVNVFTPLVKHRILA